MSERTIQRWKADVKAGRKAITDMLHKHGRNNACVLGAYMTDGVGEVRKIHPAWPGSRVAHYPQRSIPLYQFMLPDEQMAAAVDAPEEQMVVPMDAEEQMAAAIDERDDPEHTGPADESPPTAMNPKKRPRWRML